MATSFCPRMARSLRRLPSTERARLGSANSCFSTASCCPDWSQQFRLFSLGFSFQDWWADFFSEAKSDRGNLPVARSPPSPGFSTPDRRTAFIFLAISRRLFMRMLFGHHPQQTTLTIHL